MTTDDSYSSYLERDERRKKLAGELHVSNKAKLFDILQEAGIALVTVGFDGEGDSGQIEDISVFSAANEGIRLPDSPLAIHTAMHDGSGAEQSTLTVEQAIEHLCYERLWERHGGWMDNEGAYGEFVFDVAKRAIELTFNARFTDVETSTHTF